MKKYCIHFFFRANRRNPIDVSSDSVNPDRKILNSRRSRYYYRLARALKTKKKYYYPTRIKMKGATSLSCYYRCYYTIYIAHATWKDSTMKLDAVMHINTLKEWKYKKEKHMSKRDVMSLIIILTVQRLHIKKPNKKHWPNEASAVYPMCYELVIIPGRYSTVLGTRVPKFSNACFDNQLIDCLIADLIFNIFFFPKDFFRLLKQQKNLSTRVSCI